MCAGRNAYVVELPDNSCLCDLKRKPEGTRQDFDLLATPLLQPGEGVCLLVGIRLAHAAPFTVVCEVSRVRQLRGVKLSQMLQPNVRSQAMDVFRRSIELQALGDGEEIELVLTARLRHAIQILPPELGVGFPRMSFRHGEPLARPDEDHPHDAPAISILWRCCHALPTAASKRVAEELLKATPRLDLQTLGSPLATPNCIDVDTNEDHSDMQSQSDATPQTPPLFMTWGSSVVARANASREATRREEKRS